MTQILGVIPARYASSRFPAKMLAPISGKTMIERVYAQCAQAQRLADLVVATDHPAIEAEVRRFGGQVVMTRPDHPSGTDRCFEAWQKLGGQYTHVVNIQGDEPFIQPGQIDLLAGCLAEPGTELATLMIRATDPAHLTDPGEVKITFNTRHEALYFSRQPIPHLRGVPPGEWLAHHAFYRHVGIYAYRADVLAQLTQLPPSVLEECEKLEQLRWLEHGYKVRLVETDQDSFCIETPEDLAKAEAFLAATLPPKGFQNP
jgi:3-deoxy-manno-octulosonate cytidylyltransferase (CMP-KDO synthetase)